MNTSNALTPQAIFDKVCTHMAAQKMRSTIEFEYDGMLVTRCAYRSAEGLKCNAGALIPDDMYLPAMDFGHGGTALVKVATRFPWIGRLFGKNLMLVHCLQEAHDKSINAASARAKLANIAESHGLDPTKAELVQEWTNGRPLIGDWSL